MKECVTSKIFLYFLFTVHSPLIKNDIFIFRVSSVIISQLYFIVTASFNFLYLQDCYHVIITLRLPFNISMILCGFMAKSGLCCCV